VIGTEPPARRLRAAYVTSGDPSDIRAWSGTFHYIAKALAAQPISLDYLGPLQARYEALFKVREGSHRYLLRHRHPRDREPFIARHYARQVASRLRPEHDLVFAVGSIPISYLECEQPIVLWSDATFAQMVDFYPMYTNVSGETIRNGNAMEESALRRCRLLIYSSDWAAESAISDYGIDPARVAVVPLGSNMETELSRDEAEVAIAARANRTCRLLFIGVEWERKGGDRAVEIARELNAAGLETELDVVGSWPRGGRLPPFVNRLGFVDKGSPEGRRALRELLLAAHFLLLPARADCSPVVLNEAAAHALPALATGVVGIPTIVREDVNGKLFTRDASAAEYCASVLELFSDTQRYRRLALSSLVEYQQRLNWRVAGATVHRLVEDALESSPRHPLRAGS
jgi:glycosyltransferase involved in cell wall biosynthesis